MKFYQHSHFFFFISILLHISLLSLFVSGSVDLLSKPQPIQATIVFEPPPVPKPVIELKTKEVSKETTTPPKPVKKPTLQTSAQIKSTLDKTPLDGTTISKTSIDDLLQNQKPIINKQPTSTEAPAIKKTDLLGYLRATKRTKQENSQKDPRSTKPESKKDPVKAQPQIPQNPDLKAVIPEPVKPKTKEISKPVVSSSKIKDTGPLFPESQKDASRDQGNGYKTNGHTTTQLRKWKKDNEIKTYRSQLAYLISSNWTKVLTKDFQILVKATIDENGNLIDVRVVKGSGLAGMDATAISAIRKSTPFPRLPDAYKPKKQVTLVFRFTPDDVIY